ncbi:hypothetical protein RchiOBHm_Chr2g0086271 [Rosa chinensis]|uniref:Uncharacterized protein n=1 Tax=Rosa chinensis TaxID=74649 RepID=A0A2P6RIC0_ROSCH|nr:hypothetical protein RchiOBHm_Chr2g0086271 [Rosa chinensis]
MHFVSSYLDLSESADLGNVDLFCGSNAFPCLEKLFINHSKGITCLKISCPNLKDLTVLVSLQTSLGSKLSLGSTVLRMKVTSLDIFGTRTEVLLVNSCKIGSWVNIFAPKFAVDM